MSERARRRALEIADDADLRIGAPKDFVAQCTSNSGRALTAMPSRRDTRLPVPGTVLTRHYAERRIVVTVLADGFA